MRSIVSFLASFLAFASLAAAANSIKFINHCPYDIWFWPVGPNATNLDGGDDSRIRVPGNNGTATHAMVDTKSLNAGIALKVRDLPHYQVTPAGIVQIEYNFQEASDVIWYDLSIIDCDVNAGPAQPAFCPLIGGGVKMHFPGAAAEQCPSASCSMGKCSNVYEKHGSWHNEPTFVCKTGVDVHVETCFDNVGPRTFQNETVTDPVAVANSTATQE